MEPIHTFKPAFRVLPLSLININVNYIQCNPQGNGPLHKLQHPYSQGISKCSNFSWVCEKPVQIAWRQLLKNTTVSHYTDCISDSSVLFHLNCCCFFFNCQFPSGDRDYSEKRGMDEIMVRFENCDKLRVIKYFLTHE